jgi:hypothetical protein
MTADELDTDMDSYFATSKDKEAAPEAAAVPEPAAAAPAEAE